MPIFTSPQIRVSINKQDKGTIRTVGVAAPNPVDRIVELRDVDAGDLDNNETLVYDESSGKFIVKTLPIISGGVF